MDLRDPANGDSLLPPPSAKVLPPILQRKLERQLRQHHHIIAPIKADIHESAKSSSVAIQDSDRIYTADELEDELQRVNDAIAATQNHIGIAENVYYEETYSHGNIFTGWDGYIDNRDISSHANNSHGGGASSSLYAAGTHLLRKIPQDYKWFSSTTTTDNHLPLKYLSQVESDGKPVTVMSREEAGAMKRQSTKAKDAAAAQDDSDKCTSRRDDDEAVEQEDAAAETLTDETTEDDGKQTDKKGKRKAAAPPPVSTRSKRTRK